MKIALSQLNFHIGNFESNFEKIKSHIHKARQDGASLIVFPELALSGYPARDFLEQKDYLEKCTIWLQKIAVECNVIAAIIGSPAMNNEASGKNLFNTAFYLFKGEIKEQINKALLPTYDIFDEYRYFEPETRFHCFEHEESRIALTICEDLWNIVDPMYVTQPMDALMNDHPQIMINIAASPFNYNQAETRLSILKANAIKYKLPLVYVNHVGAQTDIIFDGGSVVLDSKGQIIRQLSYFTEDFAVVDIAIDTHLPEFQSNEFQSNEFQSLENKTLEKKTTESSAKEKEISNSAVDIYRNEMHTSFESIDSWGMNAAKIDHIFHNEVFTERIYEACVLGIRDYFQKLGFKKAVLGLSGGIDSALVCALASMALGPENVTAVLLPSKFSSEHSISDAEHLVKNLGNKTYTIPISAAAAAFEETLKPVFGDLPLDLTEENIQARTRAVFLMALTNKYQMVLLNTSNKSEAAVGYGTLYGDMAGALSVIGDVYKTQVYELARFINRNKEIIPANSILKPPSAELRPGQKDSDSLPEYDVLDKVLYLHIEKKLGRNQIVSLGYDQNIVEKIITLVNIAEFKRYQSAPILRVSPKSFGMGRRMPIVGKY